MGSKENNVVLSLDPRGVVQNGGPEIILRQSSYGQEISKLSKDRINKFIILSGGPHLKKEINIKNFFSIFTISRPTFNSYVFARSAKKFLNEHNFQIKLLIAGDPWESYLSCFFLNKLLKSSIPIHIQVHGDIGDKNWKNINFINFLRFSFSIIPLKKATSIRCVSVNQQLNLMKTFNIDKNRIQVVPVQIDLPKVKQKISTRPRVIGFVGRIHKDRGTDRFVRLIDALNYGNSNFQVLIAGDGPERVNFLSALGKILPKNRVRYLGQISQEELRKVWNDIGILVSVAPVESYGRALREALVFGVPVWATPSSGVMDLLAQADSGSVQILDLNKDKVSLSYEFELLMKVNVGNEFLKKFIQENNTYPKKLAKSWLKTIKSHSK